MITEQIALRETHTVNTFPSCCTTKHASQVIRLDPVNLDLRNSETSSGEAAVAVNTRAEVFQAALGTISVLDPAANLHGHFQKVLKEPFGILYVISHSICAG